MTNPSLLNAESTLTTNTTYDRSYGGAFENPYGGVPAMVFFRHKVTVDGTGELLKDKPLLNAREPFVPGKVYQLINPATNQPIPGQTFTAEQVFAMVFSVMIQNLTETAAAASDQPPA